MADSTPPRRLALITGATGGIGRATALLLARTGQYNLALHYHSASASARESLHSDLSAGAPAPIDIHFYAADLGAGWDAVRALHAAVVDTQGHPDVLFSNAGTLGGVSRPAGLANVPMEAFEQAWRVNAGAGMLLAQLCLPHMEEKQWGRIVFNSSIAGFTGGAVGPHYASSKAALHGFVHWLAGSVARQGVTVNAVAPALVVDTVMIGNGESVEELDKRYGEKIPVGRGGRAEEVAQTVLWMVNCGYVTNKVVPVDGGIYPY